MAKKARIWDGSQWVDIASAVTDLTQYANISLTQFGFRNKIINGDFRINQRGYVKNTNLASGSYGFDRWKSTFTNTSLDFVSAPNGQIVTISSGGSIEQVIERENMPAGTYTLSWVGTATGRVYNTGTTPPAFAASPITVTLDGTANVEVEFTASGGTRTLQNVELEPGTISGAFEYRPIQTELALCQRYYYSIPSGAIAIFNPYFNVGLAGGGQYVTATHPVTMRVAPAMPSTTLFTYLQNSAGSTINRNVNLTSTVLGFSAVYTSDSNSAQLLTSQYTVGFNANALFLSSEL